MCSMPDVVVLPGITGSVLRDSRGRDVWTPTARAAIRALVTLGGIGTPGPRRHPRQPGDPTWVAYTLYGDPAATASPTPGAGA
jgi:hypothetical protein